GRPHRRTRLAHRAAGPVRVQPPAGAHRPPRAPPHTPPDGRRVAPLHGSFTPGSPTAEGVPRALAPRACGLSVLPGPVRRAAAEAERRLRGGAALVARVGRDLERSAEAGRLLPVYIERVTVLEQALRDRDAELRALRTELDSLVGQLNDRVLPRIDERM